MISQGMGRGIVSPAAEGRVQSLVRHVVHRWEHRLHARANNRVVRSFDWGLDWLGIASPAELESYAGRAVAESGRYFSYVPVADYCLSGSDLTFSSPVRTPHPENNVVHGQYFPARQPRGRAVVVLPHWNAQRHEHVGLAQLLSRCGISALRLSLPYHDRRLPAETERADYAVSSNVGRTLHANQQAVIDTRAALDWLEARGYSHLGIVGTSLGSCTAFITAAHDPRVRAGAFNHVSTWFADVVWRGLSTAHVRTGLEGSIALEQLRRAWAPISPASYMGRLRELRPELPRALFLWARFDLSFPPDLSTEAVAMCRAAGMPLEESRLACGHYTSGKPPFKWKVGARIARFLSRAL